MTCYRRFMMCGLGVLAWCWCTAGGTAAHESSAASQSSSSGQAISLPQPSNIVWDAIEWIERHYKIEALGFKARDESGLDWLGDDEVMIETRDAKGWTVSDEFSDVNSGDTYEFDPTRSCIIPVRPGIVVLGKTSVCDSVGEPSLLSFGVEFREKDPLGGFCIPPQPGPGSHGGPHCVGDSNDNLLGRAQIDLTAQDLEAVLHNVGDEYIETVVLDTCPGAVCGSTYGPDYSFTYRITRLPDVRVKLSAVLDEAMRKSGARSELEAIVNGLRSLRAPSPRQIDPGIGK